MSNTSIYLNQIVRADSIDKDGLSHTGKLIKVDCSTRDPAGVWDVIEFEDGKSLYLTDVVITPVEIDGKRLPDISAVYKFTKDETSVMAQLSEDGLWFPFPYSFSEWRAGELFTFPDWKLLPEFSTDIPEILNPEHASLVDFLTSEMMTLSGVNADEVTILVRKLVIEDRLFG